MFDGETFLSLSLYSTDCKGGGENSGRWALVEIGPLPFSSEQLRGAFSEDSAPNRFVVAVCYREEGAASALAGRIVGQLGHQTLLATQLLCHSEQGHQLRAGH